jgi:hypothetical protein
MIRLLSWIIALSFEKQIYAAEYGTIRCRKFWYRSNLRFTQMKRTILDAKQAWNNIIIPQDSDVNSSQVKIYPLKFVKESKKR